MKIILCIFVYLLIFLSGFSLKVDKLKTSGDDPLANMSDEQIKSEMKKYGITDQELSLLTTDNKKAHSKIGKFNNKNSSVNEMKLKIENSAQNKEEAFLKTNVLLLKSFQLNRKDAEKLINFFQNFTVFSKLPVTAMNIVSNSSSLINNDFNYFNNFNNKLISNTLNSQVFVDSENKMGRKGMLTIIANNKNTNKNIYQQVWAVINSKVVCFYNNKQYLNIIGIFRIANLSLINSPFSPCFMLGSKTDKDNKTLICALNFREKEFWIDTLKYQIKSYKDYNIKG